MVFCTSRGLLLLSGDFEQPVRIHDGVVAATCIESLVYIHELRDPTVRDLYLTVAPDCLLRTIMIAIAPGGAFSEAI
jgi:hypothetical protein